MSAMAGLLPLMAFTGLMAALWLALMGRLLNQLARFDSEAYSALGRPVMRWLWWSWPTPPPQPGLPPFLSLTALAQRRLELHTLYTPAEIKSTLRLGRWIVSNRPRLRLSPGSKRLQRTLRVIGLVFVLGFAGVVLLAALG